MVKIKKDRIGHSFISKQGYSAIVEDYVSCEDVTVLFADSGVRVKTRWQRVLERSVENPYHKGFWGVGWIGVGKYRGITAAKAMDAWCGMLTRCYSSSSLKASPTYEGCTVCEDWLDFQNFAAWHEEFHVVGWQLDKDLFSDGVKEYSKETCCYLPQEINLLVTRILKPFKGVYCDLRNKTKTYSANYRGKSLGTYPTEDEAKAVYERHFCEQATEIISKYKSILSGEIVERVNFLIEKRKAQIKGVLFNECK